MFKSFWFTKSRKFTTKSFLEIEMQIFTKWTFLMNVPYVRDEFRNILMTNPQENKRCKRSWDKIFDAVNFLCDAPARLKTSRLHTAGFRIHLNPVL